MSDADLIARVLRGDRDRFADLVDRYLPMLRGLCASYVADAVAQQDVVQEAFVYAYEKLGRLRNPHRFGPWLARIGRSRCIDWLRQQRRRERFQERAQEIAPAAEDGSSEVMQRELREWVRSRIDQLPDKTREAMFLCYIEGRGTVEAARFLGVRETALRKRLEYGRKLVGDALCEDAGKTAPDSTSGAKLRNRILLALPAAAVPTKSAVASLAGALGGLGYAKLAAGLIVAVAAVYGVLATWPWNANATGESVVQASSPNADPVDDTTLSADDKAAAAPAQDSEDETTADGESPYNRFFFIRHNRTDGRLESSTLVLATVTSGGIDLRDWVTLDRYWPRLHPWFIGGGRVFATTDVGEGSLIAIDIATGAAHEVAQVSDFYERAGKLYTLTPLGDEATFRLYDFDMRAFRDLICIPWKSWIRDVQISPNGRYMAYFMPVQERTTTGALVVMAGQPATLHVVDFETGSVAPVAGPIEHVSSPASNDLLALPPMLWFNEAEVLLVRAEQGPSGSLDSVTRYLASANIHTSELTDLLAVPGNYFNRVRLRPGEWDERPVLDVTNLGRFTIDADSKTLTEYDGIGGDFRLTRKESGRTLFDGSRKVAEMWGNGDHLVSPDGRRVVWVDQRQYAAVGADGSYEPMTLYFYDTGAREIRELTKGEFELPYPGWRCWLREEDMTAAEPPPVSKDGWTPFEYRPWPVERPKAPDTRPDINHYLALDVTTDAESYWLHEPVEVTITLTNIGNEALTVLRPVVFDERVLETRVDGPGWSGLVDQIQSYLPEPEEIVLNPGESVSSAGLLECATEGSHTVQVEYRGYRETTGQSWRGRIQSEPVAFEILRSADDGLLFQEKVARLLDKATAEFESDPDWDGSNNTLEDLQEMGPDMAPYLLSFIATVQDPQFRNLLLRPLVNVASPEALPYFAEVVQFGAPDEQSKAIEGLHRIYKRYAGCERDDIAQSALIHLVTAIHTPDDDARFTLVRLLCQVKDDRVRESLERLVDDPDERIRNAVARYLVAYEGNGLAEWLSEASSQPTAITFAAARSVVHQLEQTWRLDNGAFPDGDWTRVSGDASATAQYRATVQAWEQWARENPRSAEQFIPQ
ncbi:MAG: RNA polymerase sigma factor [Candidatus Hydrogenedentes bacterium]|nr:RNA polymerase sigma factor [Candidatus Hydrogenedentota bacterium]